MSPSLNLQAVHPALHEQARGAFDAGDVMLLLISCMDRQMQLGFVVDNIVTLKKRGIYEPCLLEAFTNAKTNFYNWSDIVLSFLFRTADRKRLLESGDLLPEQETFRLYRGVAGVGRWRRPRGFSWTLSLDVACWFAVRFDLANPAVMSVEVPRDTVLAYMNDRHEEEILCRPETAERMSLSSEELAVHARHQTEAVEARNAELWATRKAVTQADPVAN
ncbi:MAG TPA: hypothetical protein VN688_00820 [Gemmataceae bacterium]|nr:hypothetical protein [Gemmataceae bacterium]